MEHLTEMFVLNFTKFQSVSVEAVTCLLLMVQWVSPLFLRDSMKILESRQPTTRQNRQPCQLGSSVGEILKLFIIQLRETEIVGLFSEFENCLLLNVALFLVSKVLMLGRTWHCLHYYY